MKTRCRRIVLAGIVCGTVSCLLAACAIPSAPSPDRVQVVELTGFLESSTVSVSPEMSGKIVALEFREGQEVQKGELLVRLDDSLLTLQLQQAGAEVDLAAAELEQLVASVRPEAVTQAEAAATYAEVALQASETALTDAIMLRDDPQDLDLRIMEARASVKESRAHAAAARLLAQAADVNVMLWQTIAMDLRNGVEVPSPDGGTVRVNAPADQVANANRQWNLASQESWEAWQNAYQAEAASTQAERALTDLLRSRSDLQSAEQIVVAATNARDSALVAYDQAQRQVVAVKAGPSDAQISAARERYVQARSAYNALSTRLAQTEILAPIDGTAGERLRSVGEIVGIGQPIVELQDQGLLQLTIYVPAQYLPQIKLQQTLPLSVTGSTDQFMARIIQIGTEPEYTLQQAQNVAERAASVYAVRLETTTTSTFLRPGLPADVGLTVSNPFPGNQP